MERIVKNWKNGARHLQSVDPQLAPLIAQVGPPTPKLEANPYLSLSRAILSQQLAPRAAGAIWERFLAGGGGRPGWVAQAPPEELRAFGVSGRKAKSLGALAGAFRSEKFAEALLTEERSQVEARLVELPGIGQWTVHMFLIFCRGDTDILPVGDYGVRRAVGRLRGLDPIPTPKELPGHVRLWKGWESVGSWYLWKALDRGFLV